MRLTLNRKRELAKQYYGFNKGIYWWWWLRFTFIIGSSGILAYPIQVLIHTTITDLTLCIWLFYIINLTLFGYGIYSSSSIGYKLIIISLILEPIISICLTESTIYGYTGSLQINDSIIGGIIGQTIYCGINIYYFHNRKIIFDIISETVDTISLDTPASDTTVIINPEERERNQKEKSSVFNTVSIILLISLIFACLLLLLCFLYAYGKKAENKYLSDRMEYLENQNINYSHTAEKYDNLVKYVMDYQSASGESGFLPIRNVMYVQKDVVSHGIFFCNKEGYVYCNQDNNCIEFTWDNDNSIEDVMCFDIKGIKSGCTTLTFTTDADSDLKATILVIVE